MLPKVKLGLGNREIIHSDMWTFKDMMQRRWSQVLSSGVQWKDKRQQTHTNTDYSVKHQEHRNLVLLWRWMSTGTVPSETLWGLPPQRYSKATWTLSRAVPGALSRFDSVLFLCGLISPISSFFDTFDIFLDVPLIPILMFPTFCSK